MKFKASAQVELDPEANSTIERFAGSALKELAHETIGILTDRIKVYRHKQQIALLEATCAFYEERNIQPRKVSLKNIIPILELSSLEEGDESLAQQWQNLLINNLNPESPKVPHYFSNILSQITFTDAKVLILISWLTSYKKSVARKHVLKQAHEIVGIDQQDCELSIDNLCRLALLDYHISKSDNYYFTRISDYPFGTESIVAAGELFLSQLGSQFVLACSDPATALPSKRVVVLVSGTGRNLQALIDEANGYEIVAVISNKADAYALERATKANIATDVLEYPGFNNREDYDAELIKRIDAHQPDLVLLAGFMRILSDDFVRHYHGRLLNIHPSLLPKFKGLHTHQQALDAEETEHGCTVHFVEPELDSGPLVLQGTVPVDPLFKSIDSLAEKVMEQEQRIYPLAAHWFATGRLHLANGQPMLDNQVLKQPIILPYENT